MSKNMMENAAENLISNIVETVSDAIQHQTSKPEQNRTSARVKRLFGRQETIHRIFGGGQSADLLLWRNKKISSSVLTGATAIWVLFEWLNYHFLTMFAFALFVIMLVQFGWSNISIVLNRSTTQVPRVAIPQDVFVNVATSLGAQINQFLNYIQDVACERNLRQFLVVTASLWAAAIVGTWCNFLTVIYVGFVCAHTLPVLYEKYEDEIDEFLYKLLGQVQDRYSKVDVSVLGKLSKGNLKSKKDD
ncbi:reticulon-like protein B8 [Curcuma longa]|uniref:reticulon-like protein B8 n=1 Tax=Curcuma longa TaxID=136217 RepID=UPI003D9EF88E